MDVNVLYMKITFIAVYKYLRVIAALFTLDLFEH